MHRWVNDSVGRILARYIECNTQVCRMVIQIFMFIGRRVGELVGYWGKIMACLVLEDVIYFHEEVGFYVYIGGLTELRIMRRNKAFLRGEGDLLKNSFSDSYERNDTIKFYV